MKDYPQFIKDSWIGKFISYAEPLPTPEIFKLWSAIAAVMGALERRVWVYTARTEVFANHYILCVAPPGVGKSMIIKEVHAIWNATHTLKVGPDSATKAALVDELNGINRSFKYKGEIMPFKSMCIAATEFGTLVSEYDNTTMNFYNKMWDCPNIHTERLRYGASKEIDLEYVSLSILGGTQPAYLGSILPPDAHGMGFTARLVMIYAGVGVDVDIFDENNDEASMQARMKQFDALVKDMMKIIGLCGQMHFTDEAKAFYREWQKHRTTDAPEHPKLATYNDRRPLTLQKIAMAISAACGDSMLIEKKHLEFALDCMHQAEDVMPEVFKGMHTPETSSVMAELWRYAFTVYNKIGKKPVPEHMLVDWLKSQVEIHKVDPIMKHMVTAKLLIEAPSAAVENGKFTTQGRRFTPGEKSQH